MLKVWLEDRSGATLAYISLLLTAMLGIIGLSYDLGRHYILSTELQKAADAAAMAGAYQLDEFGDPDVVAANVAAAVLDSPVAQNTQKLGSAAGIVEFEDPILLKSIPDNDDEPISADDEGPPYRYVRVITQATTSNNVFARVLGQPAQITLVREAVARKGSAVCQVTPLAICNPLEATNGSGADFPAEDYYGKQIIVRQIGGGNQAWVPGNFGFLRVGGANGANELANALASGNSSLCYNANVETQTGQVNGARNGLNTRFDIYKNPGFGGNGANSASQNPDFAPAENVTKGYNTIPNNYCNNNQNPADSSQPLIMGLPRDTNLVGATDFGRFGNGSWNCATYWNTVHDSGDPRPDGCGTTSDTPTTEITRFEVYRHEIDTDSIPEEAGGSAANQKENGQPECAGTAPKAPIGGDLSTDRRIVTMAVLNCVEYNVNGNSTVPVEVFLNGFLTEPVKSTPGSVDNGDIILEIVGSSLSGGSGNIAPVRSRDWVELVR